MSPAELTLAHAVLATLADAPEGVSLPRLCKRLGVRMSVLLRTLAWIGETAIGDQSGLGWVRLVGEGERRIAVLTRQGRARTGTAGG